MPVHPIRSQKLSAWTDERRRAILRRTVDTEPKPRVILLGHLVITVPVITGVLLVLFYGLRMFGPFLLVYYVFAGVAVGWQWCSIVVPRWKKVLTTRGAQESEVEELIRRSGLAWAERQSIGLFALHTTAAALCGIHFGPWLVGRWFDWVLPLTGVSTSTYSGDYYLQHLELMSVVPALIVGYLASLRLPRLAAWAWIVPTTILAYKLLIFADPNASVLVSHPLSRFTYFFVIQHFMPTFHDFRGSDPTRVAEQMFVVAPFYSGVAYSLGALAAKHDLWTKLVGSSLRGEIEPALSGASEGAGDANADESDKTAHEGD
jgi:hypothetical protein